LEGGEFNYSEFKTDLKNKKGALKAFDNFAKKVSVDGKKLSTLLTDDKIGGKTAEVMKSIFTMMSADDWDATTGY